jgi:hypothetical protein
MNRSLARALPDGPRKMLAGGEVSGETLRKRLAEGDDSSQIGRVIERALTLANLTKQEVAHAMGYADQSALSRWIAGVETAQMAKLWRVRALRGALVVALAEAAQDDVEVRTVVTLKRRTA